MGFWRFPYFYDTFAAGGGLQPFVRIDLAAGVLTSGTFRLGMKVSGTPMQVAIFDGSWWAFNEGGTMYGNMNLNILGNEARGVALGMTANLNLGVVGQVTLEFNPTTAAAGPTVKLDIGMDQRGQENVYQVS